MLVLSPLLTILAVLIIGLVMLLVTNKIGGKSGKYFVRQQKALADVTGFVEETNERTACGKSLQPREESLKKNLTD